MLQLNRIICPFSAIKSPYEAFSVLTFAEMYVLKSGWSSYKPLVE